MSLTALVCAVFRHDWATIPAHTTDHGTFGPYRVCARQCHSYEPLVLATQPPAGHPDSMTTELPREQEAQLAELDAALFPQEAK